MGYMALRDSNAPVNQSWLWDQWLMWLQRWNVYDIIFPSGTWNVSDVNAIICHSNYSLTNLLLHLTGRVIHCTSVRTAAQSLGKSGGNITGLECRPTFLELHENVLDHGSESCPPHVIKAFNVGWLRRAHCSRYTVLFVYPLLLPIWCTDG